MAGVIRSSDYVAARVNKGTELAAQFVADPGGPSVCVHVRKGTVVSEDLFKVKKLSVGKESLPANDFEREVSLSSIVCRLLMMC